MPEILHLHNTEEFRALIRLLSIFPIFDRLGLALALRQPFGTVSRVISELENEGYILPIDQTVTYFVKDYIDSPDFYYTDRGGRKRMIWHYTSSKAKAPDPIPKRGAKATSLCYVRSEKWRREFVDRWNLFIK